MNDFPQYRHFVSYCRRYEKALEILKKQRFDPTDTIDMAIRDTLKQETETVDAVFEKLAKTEPKLAGIMYLKLVKKKPLREIELDSSIDMSRRQIVMKYPERSWEDLYNDLLG